MFRSGIVFQIKPHPQSMFHIIVGRLRGGGGLRGGRKYVLFKFNRKVEPELATYITEIIVTAGNYQIWWT